MDKKEEKQVLTQVSSLLLYKYKINEHHIIGAKPLVLRDLLQ
jgi:hypothetical protein